MSIPPQSVVPGQLADEYARQQQLFMDQRIVGRLCAKDASLWPAGEFNQDKCVTAWIKGSRDSGRSIQRRLDGELSGKGDGLEQRALLAFNAMNFVSRWHQYSSLFLFGSRFRPSVACAFRRDSRHNSRSLPADAYCLLSSWLLLRESLGGVGLVSLRRGYDPPALRRLSCFVLLGPLHALPWPASRRYQRKTRGRFDPYRR